MWKIAGMGTGVFVL